MTTPPDAAKLAGELDPRWGVSPDEWNTLASAYIAVVKERDAARAALKPFTGLRGQLAGIILGKEYVNCIVAIEDIRKAVNVFTSLGGS